MPSFFQFIAAMIGPSTTSCEDGRSSAFGIVTSGGVGATSRARSSHLVCSQVLSRTRSENAYAPHVTSDQSTQHTIVETWQSRTTDSREPTDDIDGILLLSFGGPEQSGDVMPFLRTVTRGRGVPDERLETVAEQYALFDGKSPINDQNRALRAALETELHDNGIELPVYWGNRNWHPFVADTLARMTSDGRRNVLVFTTSAYSSYSGCRQYREDLEAAARDVGGVPRLEKLRQFFNHPGFVGPSARRVDEAIRKLGGASRSSDAHIVFTAHSIPEAAAKTSRYEMQLREAASLVAASLGLAGSEDGRWSIAFQSRSGAPQTPWLEPDIVDHLDALARRGANAVVIAPIGFVSDHIEVLYDLDTVAVPHAEALGMSAVRAETVGVDPEFVTMIRTLIEERIWGTPPLALGDMGPTGCLVGPCCQAQA